MPSGPVRVNEIGSSFGMILSVNSKNGQHNLSFEINPASFVMDSAPFGKINSMPFVTS